MFLTAALDMREVGTRPGSGAGQGRGRRKGGPHSLRPAAPFSSLRAGLLELWAANTAPKDILTLSQGSAHGDTEGRLFWPHSSYPI